MNIFERFAGKFACIALRRHKRGIRIPPDSILEHCQGIKVFMCPRCGSRWSRKVRNVQPTE